MADLLCDHARRMTVWRRASHFDSSADDFLLRFIPLRHDGALLSWLFDHRHQTRAASACRSVRDLAHIGTIKFSVWRALKCISTSEGGPAPPQYVVKCVTDARVKWQLDVRCFGSLRLLCNISACVAKCQPLLEVERRYNWLPNKQFQMADTKLLTVTWGSVIQSC